MTLDNQLWRLQHSTQSTGYNPDHREQLIHRNTAKDAILSDLMELLPNKKTIDTEHNYNDNFVNKGFNKAINEMKAGIETYVRGEK